MKIVAVVYWVFTQFVSETSLVVSEHRKGSHSFVFPQMYGDHNRSPKTVWKKYRGITWVGLQTVGAFNRVLWANPKLYNSEI